MSESPAYLNMELSFEERARDLLSRMTTEEKVSQLLFTSPAIDRLGIPSYNWWNEALHGVARAGVATVFPQAIALSAIFDDDCVEKIADVISTEGRAKFHDAARHNDRRIYHGLTFWSPNVNIFRDPRWGRGHETYGEDPYHTGRTGCAFVRGIQGRDPKYLKAAACAKHMAVHSGPEAKRHGFNAKVSRKDLFETYLPAFRALVGENVESVMGAYNRTNDEACCASKTLLGDILRGQWHFKGHVVSDCGAISDIHNGHGITATGPESAALAVKTGCDLECGSEYGNLLIALRDGLLEESDIDRALTRVLMTRLKLGMFDDPNEVPYADTPIEVNDCAEHRALNVKAAEKSLVLLKNDGTLPLYREDCRTIAVIGPNAASEEVLIGNYNGTPSRPVTLLDGIRAAVPDAEVLYSSGCALSSDNNDLFFSSEALSIAERADAVILAVGYDHSCEGEEGDAANSAAGGDKLDLKLPGRQEELIRLVASAGKPTVVVLFTGSSVAPIWADEHCNAILNAWYPGGEGGTAIASALFGDVSPAGRLPVTFYRAVEDLPDFEDYSMANRTYRYFKGDVLYPFGFGLSYSTFEYSNLRLSSREIGCGGSMAVTATVKNTGDTESDEVAELYLRDEETSCAAPRWELRGYQRVHLKPGESANLSFLLSARDMALINEEGEAVVEPGKFTVYVGGSQPDTRSVELNGAAPLSIDFRTVGEAARIPY